MRPSIKISLCGLTALLASCGTYDPAASIGMPEDDFSSRNPLDVVRLGEPRSGSADSTSDSDGTFNVGDYVETIQPNTPLFGEKPRSGSVPTEVLDQGVGLIVLAFNGNYMQVQTEKGEIGYVAKLTVAPQGVGQAGASDSGDIVLKESEIEEIADIVSGDFSSVPE